MGKKGVIVAQGFQRNPKMSIKDNEANRMMVLKSENQNDSHRSF